ncbi:MAG: L-fucose/L-arabinose isomerase family protein [Anaerolineae bacterium]|nr:L-fucose/L-arabinose isomerase family protein [Anaerolineae bacterium]
MKKPVLGIIIGNRGFFPTELCEEGRETILKVFEAEGITPVLLSPEETPYGSVESLEDARKCANLFRAHRDEIDGILITLPNFGEEGPIANTLRWAELGVPVLIQATPDDANLMSIKNRRDSFCGKMSTCNNLKQCGIPYSLTTLHTVGLESESFRKDLRNFVATCRVVKGLKHARIGMIGARPAAFNTVRFSEKLFERSGISVDTIDLSEIFGRIERLKDDDPALVAKLDELRAYLNVKTTPSEALVKMSKFGVVVDQWMEQEHLIASAVQCWTAIEEYYGVVPCAMMSMMSQRLVPSACETDIAGVIGMAAMALASGKPSALADWNNNYGDDPNKGVLFHCSNLPKDFFAEAPDMDYQEIIAGTVGKANTHGTVVGRVKAAPFTYTRISTADWEGKIKVYLGQGALTKDPLQTFGGYGVFEIPNLQSLLRYICENGFEHHVAVNLSQVADAVNEALSKYLGWDVYYHR